MTPRLTVTTSQPGYQRVSISGTLSMTRAEAQGLIDEGGEVVLHLWGEDPSYDDLLNGPYPARISATPAGLEFRRELLVIGNAAPKLHAGATLQGWPAAT